MRFLLPLICGSTLFIFSKIAIILFLLPVDIYIYIYIYIYLYIYIYVILTLGGVMQQVCVLPCGYVFILHDHFNMSILFN